MSRGTGVKDFERLFHFIPAAEPTQFQLDMERGIVQSELKNLRHRLRWFEGRGDVVKADRIKELISYCQEMAKKFDRL